MIDAYCDGCAVRGRLRIEVSVNAVAIAPAIPGSWPVCACAILSFQEFRGCKISPWQTGCERRKGETTDESLKQHDV